jgi:hypothetical protein
MAADGEPNGIEGAVDGPRDAPLGTVVPVMRNAFAGQRDYMRWYLMDLKATLLAIAATGLFATGLAPAVAAQPGPVDCAVYPHGEPNGIQCNVDDQTEDPPADVPCELDPDGIHVPSTYCEYVNGVLDDPQNACDTGEFGVALTFCEDHGPFEPCPQSHCPPKPGQG